jgi:hypothetical protein
MGFPELLEAGRVGRRDDFGQITAWKKALEVGRVVWCEAERLDTVTGRRAANAAAATRAMRSWASRKRERRLTLAMQGPCSG